MSVLCNCQSYLSIYLVLHPMQVFYIQYTALKMGCRCFWGSPPVGSSYVFSEYLYLCLIYNYYTQYAYANLTVYQYTLLGIWLWLWVLVSGFQRLYLLLHQHFGYYSLQKQWDLTFWNLIINLFGFNQFVILSSGVSISSSKFL